MGTLWELSLRSFVGVVPWATHYMAELKYVQTEGEFTGEKRKVEVNYVMWPERAKELSTEDFKVRAGDYTTRFTSRDEAIGASKVVFDRLAGKGDVLTVEGDWLNPGLILAGDPDVVDVLAPIGEEYERVASFRDYTPEMRALAKQWCEALESLGMQDVRTYGGTFTWDDPKRREQDEREQLQAWVHSVDGIWTWIDEDDLPDPRGYKTGSFALEEPDDY